MACYRGYLEHLCAVNLSPEFLDNHIATYLHRLQQVHNKIDQSAVLSLFMTEVFNFEHRMYVEHCMKVILLKSSRAV